jgi:dihydrofolate reductase
MAKLIYSAIGSIDGYLTDAKGDFDWAAPDEEVHAFVNDLLRPVGTHLYGRRMYEVMSVWEHPEVFGADTPVVLDFAEVWQAADKVVYSATLAEPTTARTRIERTFDADAIRQLKQTSTSDITVGGPTLAAHAIAAGLVDEWQLFAAPVVVGGGLQIFPDHVRVDLELLDERRFEGGMVYTRYRTR